jgi:hypothetical protein
MTWPHGVTAALQTPADCRFNPKISSYLARFGSHPTLQVCNPDPIVSPNRLQSSFGESLFNSGEISKGCPPIFRPELRNRIDTNHVPQP